MLLKKPNDIKILTKENTINLQKIEKNKSFRKTNGIKPSFRCARETNDINSITKDKACKLAKITTCVESAVKTVKMGGLTI